jgi:hypothetical protein
MCMGFVMMDMIIAAQDQEAQTGIGQYHGRRRRVHR